MDTIILESGSTWLLKMLGDNRHGDADLYAVYEASTASFRRRGLTSTFACFTSNPSKFGFPLITRPVYIS